MKLERKLKSPLSATALRITLQSNWHVDIGPLSAVCLARRHCLHCCNDLLLPSNLLNLLSILPLQAFHLLQHGVNVCIMLRCLADMLQTLQLILQGCDELVICAAFVQKHRQLFSQALDLRNTMLSEKMLCFVCQQKLY